MAVPSADTNFSFYHIFKSPSLSQHGCNKNGTKFLVIRAFCQSKQDRDLLDQATDQKQSSLNQQITLCPSLSHCNTVKNPCKKKRILSAVTAV